MHTTGRLNKFLSHIPGKVTEKVAKIQIPMPNLRLNLAPTLLEPSKMLTIGIFSMMMTVKMSLSLHSLELSLQESAAL